MTPEELQQFELLKREVQDLKSLILKDNFSDLQIFRKKTEFKGDTTITKADITNLNDLTQTGGTAVIADGVHTVSIGAGGGSITVQTKNGVITAIS